MNQFRYCFFILGVLPLAFSFSAVHAMHVNRRLDVVHAEKRRRVAIFEDRLADGILAELADSLERVTKPTVIQERFFSISFSQILTMRDIQIRNLVYEAQGPSSSGSFYGSVRHTANGGSTSHMQGTIGLSGAFFAPEESAYKDADFTENAAAGFRLPEALVLALFGLGLLIMVSLGWIKRKTIFDTSLQKAQTKRSPLREV